MTAPCTAANLCESIPPVLLRGTGRGLEIHADGAASLDDLTSGLQAQLEQSPAFFEGSDVTLRLSGRTLPVGGLARLDSVASRFGLRIVEVRPMHDAPIEVRPDEDEDVTVFETPDMARLVTGPVRSGALIDACGHVVVIGDVNPGAEIRAGGNIIVIGALRGLAHAACGGEIGYILALRLEAQQLRIGALIARAGDSSHSRVPEIAYATGGQIIVEIYQGKLQAGSTTVKRQEKI